MQQRTRTVVIKSVERISDRVKAFTLADAGGNQLPAFSAGSHITLSFTDGIKTWCNSYSLTSHPGDTGRYRIAVRREDEDNSKGGSIYLHERAAPGMTFEMGGPRNFFPIARSARRHVLIAGGIGITPFLSYLPALAGTPFELHYAFRDGGAFCDRLCADYPAQTKYYVTGEGERLVPRTILENRPLGTHVYACGPQSLLRAVNQAAAELGYPEAHVHFEEFVPPRSQDAQPFVATVPSLGITVDVAPNQTLLEALEKAGAPISSSCRVGQCGTCEVGVLGGEPDHNDRCLTREERDAGRMIACVSRCRGAALELALPGG